MIGVPLRMTSKLVGRFHKHIRRHVRFRRASIEALEPRLPLDGAFPLESLVLTETIAPGIDGNVTFKGFSAPVIGAQQHVVFGADIGGNFISDSLWSSSEGQLQLIAREGSAAPGTDESFHNILPFEIAAGGTNHVIFKGDVDDSRVRGEGLWRRQGGPVELVGVDGALIPGRNDAVFGGFDSPAINDSGQAVFKSQAASRATGLNDGVWISTPGSLVPVALGGDPAPDVGANVQYRSVRGGELINPSGQTVYVADIEGDGVSTTNDSVMYRGTAGDITALLREGDNAPGIDTAFVTMVSDSLRGINGLGQVLFHAAAGSSAAGVDSSNDEGLWVADDEGITLIAREGSVAPGAGPATFVAQFQNQFKDAAISGSGHVAFRGDLGGPGVTDDTNSGIWTGMPGDLRLIAREGDRAPGTPDGVVFAGGGEVFQSLHVNANGQVAFWASIGGPGLDSFTDHGIWATDASGQLQLVAWDGGSELPLSGDNVGLASSLTLAGRDGGSGGQDGRDKALNDQGQIVFSASYSTGAGTGEGIFFADLGSMETPIPPDLPDTTPADATPPDSALRLPTDIIQGRTTSNFVVTYTDPNGVDAAMLDDTDILVTGQNGYSRLAQLTGTMDQGDTIHANYEFGVPGGSWDSADNGPYQVVLQAGQVADQLANMHPADVQLGTFSVALGECPTATTREVVTWSGEIADGTVWAGDRVHYLMGDVNVPQGATLVIEPCAIVKLRTFASDDILVDGTLIADGAPNLPIIITSDRDDVGGDTNGDADASAPANGDWNALQLRETSTGNVLDHVQILYGGAGSPAQLRSAAPLVLTNSVLANSSTSGLRIETSNPTITGSVFQDNAGAAISMDLASNPEIHGVTLHNNGANALDLDGGTLVGNRFWDDPDIVYRTNGDTRVSENSTLTITAGQVVKLRTFSGDELIVEGTLVADGTPIAPIVFTSDRDDTAGGDTNNDGENSVPGNGHWNSIQLRDTSSGNILDHVEVRYGGAGAPAQLHSSAPLSLTNSVLRNSSSSGLRIETSNPVLMGNTFQDNSGAAIRMDLASNPNIQGVNVQNNGANALVLDGGELVGNGFWDDPDIVYRSNGDITVPGNTTLTVGAGLVFKARAFSGDDLFVDGTLIADGTQAAPIVFTSDRDDTVGGDTNNDGENSVPGNGHWNRIELRNASTGNVLDHVQVRYGGAGSAAQLLSAVPLSLTNSVLRNSSSSGLRIETSNPVITGNTFQDNSGAAISVDLASNPDIQGVNVQNNGANALVLDGGELLGDGFWDDPDIVYRSNGDITVPEGAILTVGAGQVFKVRAFAGDDLVVDGTLSALGTPAAPIIFTSDRDDTAGGDTNNDQQNSGPANGQWNSIQFNNTSVGNRLEHVEVRYGGAGSSGVVRAEGADLAIRNSVLRNSSTDGFTASSGTQANLVSNLIVFNTSEGILAESGSNVTAINNTINANARGAGADGATSTLTLINNLITGHPRSGVYRANDASVTVSFNDVFNPGASLGNYEGLADSSGTSGNVSVDPLYVDTGSFDYRLGSDSPVIDAADGNTAPATDHLGNSRVDDPNVPNTGTGNPNFADLGALEKVPFSPLSVDIVDVVPNPRFQDVMEVAIAFSEAVVGFDLTDLTLTRQSADNLLTAAATLDSADGRNWTLDNLQPLTDQPGGYQLTLTAAASGIRSISGAPLNGGDTAGWTDIREAGDANTDGRFDQLDIVAVLQAGKYFTGQPASWAEGDWTADDLFNQFDIIEALQTGNYLQGPYAANGVGLATSVAKRGDHAVALDAIDVFFAEAR